MTAAVCERAVEVQGLLARRGHHRAGPLPDLLIAAAADGARGAAVTCRGHPRRPEPFETQDGMSVDRPEPPSSVLVREGDAVLEPADVVVRARMTATTDLVRAVAVCQRSWGVLELSV